MLRASPLRLSASFSDVVGESAPPPPPPLLDSPPSSSSSDDGARMPQRTRSLTSSPALGALLDVGDDDDDDDMLLPRARSLTPPGGRAHECTACALPLDDATVRRTLHPKLCALLVALAKDANAYAGDVPSPDPGSLARAGSRRRRCFACLARLGRWRDGNSVWCLARRSIEAACRYRCSHTRSRACATLRRN